LVGGGWSKLYVEPNCALKWRVSRLCKLAGETHLGMAVATSPRSSESPTTRLIPSAPRTSPRLLPPLAPLILSGVRKQRCSRKNFFALGGLVGGQGLRVVTKLGVPMLQGRSGCDTVAYRPLYRGSVKRSPQLICSSDTGENRHHNSCDTSTGALPNEAWWSTYVRN